MKYDTPVGANPLDNLHGLVGKPLDRVDGKLKVSGLATYAAEYAGQSKALYGYALAAGIARGRVLSLDTAAAEAMPGVRLVLTHKNAPPQPKPAGAGQGKPVGQLTDDRVRQSGQVIALVVADGFEQARAAAMRLRPTYAREPIAAEMEPLLDQGVKPSDDDNPDSAVGDFDGAFESSAIKLDVTYTTPHQHHAMMEPHATMAEWSEGRLTLHTANQMPVQGVESIATTLGTPKDKIRMVSRYIGGGFGGKLEVWADAVLAAMASRQLGGRAVKVVLTRPQTFSTTGHRPRTIQRLRLGTDKDGRIQAIGHDVWNDTNRDDDQTYFETSADATRTLYAGANRRTSGRVVKLDLPLPTSMRAPGEAVGLLALECAMDELAEKAGLDPVELRIRNEPTEDPEKHIPYSSRSLIPCMKTGAARFGWDRREATPGRRVDGRWKVGMGMAAATRAVLFMPAQCRVTLNPDGRLTARLAMTDIGTGSYTILTQIAAEMLGLPMDRVEVLMGDTDFPPTFGSGGSWGAQSSGSAVFEACNTLRARLAGSVGADAAHVRFENGHMIAGNTSRSLVELAAGQPVEAMGAAQSGALAKAFSQQSYGAHFAEVGVDMDTCEVRLRRMTSVFAAGRILNEKTARSQCLGGMTMGLGAALTEEMVVDPRFGVFVNHDLAEYHVPANADVPALEVIFLSEDDDKVSPIKAKGIGELGICGVGAAVANAVYNATGVRIRDYPLTLDKVLKGMRAA